MKYYDSTLDDTHFYEKIKKENDERRIDNAYKFAVNSHSNLDDYHDRKTIFYDKMINSNANNRYKYNKLNFHTNIHLEKYAATQPFQDTCPGLKPSSNWPISLDDLLTKLSTTKVEELFHQPFDVFSEFHREAIRFIRKYFDLISTDYLAVYEEYLIKSIHALLSIKILEGNFTKLYDMIDNLSQLNKKNNKLFKDIFAKSLKYEINPGINILKDKFVEMFSYYADNKYSVYPIMRNYSIIDFFNISKNILFTATRTNFHNSTSITTDSKYLYIILSGINGGMLKVGTGNDGTIKGKVYLFEKLPHSTEDVVHQWVYVKGKLYVKSNFLGNVIIKDFGYLTIINPDNFHYEGRTKLLFNEVVKHPILRKRNDNYVLSTDGENINVLLLEPAFKDGINNMNKEDDEENSDDENELFDNNASMNIPNAKESKESISLKKGRNVKSTTTNEVQYPADIFTHINLVAYTFPVDPSISKTNPDKEPLINEIYESFSYLFSKEECKKALILNNWNICKTALYLVENEKEIKQPLLISEKNLLLIQTKIESTNFKNNRADFRIAKNSVFDVTQFDLLKWAFSKHYVMAYKLKEGACVLFSRNINDITEHKYSYTICEPLPGQFSFNTSTGEDTLLDKKFVNEGMTRLKYPAKLEKDNIPKDLKDHSSFKDKILKDIAKEGSYGNLHKEDISKFYTGFDMSNKDTSGTNKNAYVRGNFSLDNSDAYSNTTTTNNNVLTNPFSSVYSSSFQPYGGGGMGFTGNSNLSTGYSGVTTNSIPANQNNYIGYGYGYGKYTGYNNYEYKKDIAPKKEKEKIDKIEKINDSLPNSEDEIMPDKKSDTVPLNSVPRDKKTKKIINKKEKFTETTNTRKEEITKKLKNLKERTAQADLQPMKEEADIKIEEKVITESVKGSFIKVIHGIQLTKYDNTFCYDPVKKIYYILCNGSLVSLSILVVNSFEENYVKLREIITADHNQIEAYLTNEIFLPYDNVDFQQFEKNLTNLLLLLNAKKYDLPWKYKNWNFYYNFLSENLSLKSSRDFGYDNYANDYSFPLLPVSGILNNTNWFKLLLNKIEKTAEINEKILKEQLPEEFWQSYKVEQESGNGDIFRKNIEKKSIGNSINSVWNTSLWANWTNMSGINFTTKENIDNECNLIKNEFLYLDNKKYFYMSIDGEIETLSYLTKSLDSETGMENILRILTLIYFWTENSNPIILFSRNTKNDAKDLICRLNNSLKLLLSNTDDETILAMIYRIVLTGWDIFDLKTQLEYFNSFYKLDKNSKLEKVPSPDLELNILNVDTYSNNPLPILYQKLSNQNSLTLFYNFTKINSVKTYHIYSKSNRLTARTNHLSINPKNTGFPFHWVYLGYKLKTYAENNLSYINNLSPDYLNNNLSRNSESNKYHFNFSYLSSPKIDFLSNSKGLNLIKETEFDSEEDLSIGKEKENLFSSKTTFQKYIEKTNNDFPNNDDCLIDLVSTRKTLLNFDYNDSIEQNSLEKMSEDLWDFVTQEILQNNNLKLLKLISDWFVMSIGDLNEYAIYNMENPSDKNFNFDKNYCDKIFNFLNKNFILMKKLLGKVKSNISGTNGSEVQQILSFANDVLYSIFSKIRQSPIQILQELQINFVDLINELTQEFKAIIPFLQTVSSCGNEIEKEKYFEYNLGNDITNIYEIIKFPGNSTIVVEIELKVNQKEKPANYDLIVVSEDHSYSQLKNNTNNNYNNYGTCFLMKLNSNLNKKLFLSGEEIKIISPSDQEFNKGGYGRSSKFGGYGKGKKDPTVNNPLKSVGNNKSSLKIKCYTFNNSVYCYKNDENFNVLSNNNKEIYAWIELLRDIDYNFRLINKLLIKSMQTTTSELNDGKYIVNEPILRLGLKNYDNVQKEFENLYRNQPIYRYFSKKGGLINKTLKNSDGKNLFSGYNDYNATDFPDEIQALLKLLIYENNHVIETPNSLIY